MLKTYLSSLSSFKSPFFPNLFCAAASNFSELCLHDDQRISQGMWRSSDPQRSTIHGVQQSLKLTLEIEARSETGTLLDCLPGRSIISQCRNVSHRPFSPSFLFRKKQKTVRSSKVQGALFEGDRSSSKCLQAMELEDHSTSLCWISQQTQMLLIMLSVGCQLNLCSKISTVLSGQEKQKEM